MAESQSFLVSLLLSTFLLVSSTQLVLSNKYHVLDVALLMREVDSAVVSSSQQLADQELVWRQSSRDGDKTDRILSLKLLHRDSVLSPFRRERVTREELWLDRLDRDQTRVEYVQERARRLKQKERDVDNKPPPITRSGKLEINGFSSPVVSGLSHGSGEYFTRLGVGTPAHQIYMVLDTASDISWIQCAPCISCYNQTDPIFTPSRSVSFHDVDCRSHICSKRNGLLCAPKANRCLYHVAYGDGSFTAGHFFFDTLSFHRASFNNVALGCGQDNEGLFHGAGGLLGLGGGTLSFVSQMGAKFNHTFSYCLVDRYAVGSSSTIRFGNAAIPDGSIFTPLVKYPLLSTFYFVSLRGISVGGTPVTIPPSAFKFYGNDAGGVVVDSGTSVTRLVEAAYVPLRTAFRAATTHLPRANGFSVLETCYDLSAASTVSIPTITLHFANDANVLLPARNYLTHVDDKGTFCFSFAASNGPLSIIGNIQQQGFRMVFDGKYKRVGFTPNQCE